MPKGLNSWYIFSVLWRLVFGVFGHPIGLSVRSGMNGAWFKVHVYYVSYRRFGAINTTFLTLNNTRSRQ